MAEEIKLLRAAREGNTAAFEQIVVKYQSLVCAITFSGTGRVDISEELAQETFLSAWKNLHQLKDLGGFRAWLCAIARSMLNGYYRKKKPVPLDSANLAEIPDTASNPSEILISQEEHIMLERAIMRIPTEYREPLVMYYRHNKSVQEVALGLGLKESTVRTRLMRGRNMLKEQVAGMIESTLSHTGPGKAFTTMVVASIAGLALTSATATAATATTSTGTAATSSGSSGLAALTTGITAKIITAAAVVAVGVGAVFTYKYLTKSQPSTERPDEIAFVQEEQKLTESSENIESESSEIKKIAENTAKVSNPQTAPIPSEVDIANVSNAGSISRSETIEPEQVTSITGLVIDKTTSNPISKAEVYMRTPIGKMSVKTDASGKFNISMNLKGNKKVPDKFEHFFNVIAKTYTTRRVSIHIEKNKIADIGTVELTPGTKVAGTVYDQNHKPIKGAKVATFHFTNHPVTTDAEGKFEIDGLDPGWSSYSLQSEHSGYPSATVIFSPLKASETIYKDIIMTKGITVHGQITDTEGKPIRGVAIGNTTSRCMWNVIEDKTDAEGNYTLKNVPPGELVIWTINKKYAPYVETFTLNSDSDKKQIDVQLLDPTPLYGRVVDNMDNPVPGVSVCIREYKGVSNLSKYRVETDAEGLFTIPNAPPEGKLILSVFSKNVPNTHPELKMGQEFYTITVDRAGKIYGKVIAKESQRPTKNFTVKMGFSKASESKSGYAATWSRQGHTFSSNEGYFDTGTENIPIGSAYALTVFADGFEPLMIDPVFVQSSSSNPERTEFALNPARFIKGIVSDCNQVGIPEVRIRWVTSNTDDEHWDDRDTAVTDTDGQFSITSIGNNVDAMYVSAALFSPLIFTPDKLPYNDDGILEFKLEKAPYLYGVVTDNNGKPIVGAGVRVQPHYDIERNWRFPSPQTTTDINGFYEIFDLPTGPASIMVSWPNKMSSSLNQKRVVFKAGQEMELNFSPVKSLTISGTIPDHIKSTENVLITPYLYHPGYISDRDWDNYGSDVAKIHTDGSFSCQGLREGKYFLFLSTQDGQYSITDIFELDADNPIENLIFNPSTSALEVRVIDTHNGREIPGVGLHLRSEFGYWLFSKKHETGPDDDTDSVLSDVAVFDFIPAGKYKVGAFKKGYYSEESEYTEVFENEKKSITVEMTPCAIASFVLTQTVVDGLVTDQAFLECTITDNISGQTVPVQSNSKVNMHNAVFTKSSNEQWNEASLNLPEGNYTINYSLYTIESGKKRQLLKSSNSLVLKTGETTTISIVTDSQ